MPLIQPHDSLWVHLWRISVLLFSSLSGGIFRRYLVISFLEINCLSKLGFDWLTWNLYIHLVNNIFINSAFTLQWAIF